jgi:hypothetical protein
MYHFKFVFYRLEFTCYMCFLVDPLLGKFADVPFLFAFFGVILCAF